MTIPSSDYQPFLRSPVPGAELKDGVLAVEEDWTETVELETATELTRTAGRRLRVLVLYGSLRERWVLNQTK